ncbi:MAG: hypothetical protein ACREUC_11735 [Steroidobacteraceae bacterium]
MVRWTVLVATMAWAAGEVCASHGADSRARAFYTGALALALVHVALAFHITYAWSHEAAVAETARQTASFTGWAWGGGVFVNYVFLAVWLTDACWWWVAPASRAQRAPAVEATRLGLFVFMFVNGAIVFAAGIGRLIGSVSVGAVVAAHAARRRHAMTT